MPDCTTVHDLAANIQKHMYGIISGALRGQVTNAELVVRIKGALTLAGCPTSETKVILNVINEVVEKYGFESPAIIAQKLIERREKVKRL